MTSVISSADALATVRTGCVVLEPATRGALIEVRGADRARFLQGYVTCDVAALEPGHGVYGFVTTAKGRIQADLKVLAGEDSLLLITPSELVDGVVQHLSKYVLADRVEMAPVASASCTVLGATAIETLGQALDEPLAEPPADVWGHRSSRVGDARVVVVREPDLRHPAADEAETVPCWTAWVLGEPETVAAAEASLHQALAAVPRAGAELGEILRVAAGRGRFGVDFDDANFPHETGLEAEGVSYTKGCYLGQEVVARIHYRGGVNRLLRGLVIGEAAANIELVGRELTQDGRAAGRLTSLAQPEGSTLLGLSVLHLRVEPGTEVELDGTGTTARVVELPFAASDFSL